MNIEKPIISAKAYLTTLDICPYDKSKLSFYVPFFANLSVQANSIMHEFMHSAFLTNYESRLIDSGVDKTGVLEINEALAALLNVKFADLLVIPECNHKPSAKDLQQEVVRMAKSGESFEAILCRLTEMRRRT